MKRQYYFISLLLAASSLYALPQGEEIVSGNADFQISDSQSLKIRASDKAILEYSSFNIDERESVEFIQPSAKSTVLNRITSQNPSKILGNLNANGRVFLVNPNGVYFGPNATVSTASFLASTLNIRNEDFINENYQFYLEPGSESSSIINDGFISSPEGFISFLAPIIENRGSVLAKAGKVAFASAEKVTLDFTGDGLIQFSVDGDLKESLIENYGQIEATNGSVQLSLRTAKKAIKMVVNADGITPANGIEENNGIVRLVHNCKVTAKNIRVDGGEGSKIDVQGLIDASSQREKGGAVQILGENIQLIGAKIDASGTLGGGVIQIGGDYQGKGDLFTAQNMIMNKDSSILANAYEQGDGGKVILWSEKITHFNGKIYAQGGSFNGNGGFVETSGKMDLGSEMGYVNTLAPFGKAGDWLLDPNNITIATGGGGTIAQCSAPNCATNGNITIAPATIAASATNVALCAQRNTNSTITVTNAVTMTNAGVSLSLTAGSANAGTINLNNSITTRGAAINMTGLVVVGANVTLDTTNGGASPAGSNITFSNTVNGSGARTLTLNSGTGGTVTMTGAVGGTTALSSLTATGATITQTSTARTTGALAYTGSTAININGNITTTTVTTGTVTMTGPVVLTNTPTIDTTNAGATNGGNITFTSTINGNTSLTLRAGTATVALQGAVGGTTPLTNLAFTSAGAIQIGNNITVTGANPLSFPFPVSLTGTSNITSNNANISFGSTLNGAQALTITGGSGTTTFTGAVGGTTPLGSLSATAATITQTSTAKTTGTLSYTGSTAININGNVTTSGGAISMTGPVAITTTPTFDTTNGGGTPAGNNISFSSTINGGTTLTLNAGTGGTASFTGAVGGVTPLTTFTVTGATVTQGSTARTTGALSYTGTSVINLGGNITTSGNTITLTGPVTLNANVVLDPTNSGGSPAGAAISLTSNVTQATTDNLTVNGGTGGTVSIGGNMNVNTFTVTNSAGTTVTGTTTASTITLTNTTGNITFNGATTVSTAFNTAAVGYNLVFNNGGTITPSTTLINTGGVTLKSGISPSLTFANGLTSTASTTTILGTIKTSTAAAAMSYGTVTFSAGSSALATPGGTVGFGGTVTLTGNASVDTTNSGGTPAGANITFSGAVNGPGNLTLNSGTAGDISFVGAVGGAPQISVLTITSAHNVTANAITASSIVQSAGTNNTTFNGLVNTNGASGISLTGTNFAINANVTTTNNGPFTINHTGSYTIAAGVTLNISGTYSDNGSGSGTTNLQGNIITNGTNITFSNPVLLVGTASLNTGSGVGNIQFLSTLDGTQNLTLATGNGNITFTGTVGTTRLGTLTINTTNNVTANALSATVYNQTAGTGTTTFNGALNLSGGGTDFSFVGNNLTYNNSVVTTSGGAVSAQVAGTLTLTSSAALNLDGAFTQSGTGNVHLAGSITTTNDTVQFAGAVAVTSAAAINTGTGIGNILFSSTVDGPGALTLTAGTGNITFSAAAGGTTRLGALTLNSATNVSTLGISAASINQAVMATGTSNFAGDLNTNTSSGIQLNSAALTVNSNLITTNTGPVTLTHNGTLNLTAGASTLISSSFTENGTGAVNLTGTIAASNAAVSFVNAITLTGTTSINSGSGAGSILFSSTIDGGQNLTVSSGSGNTTFTGNVGSGTRLNNLTITQANNVTANSITAATLSQINGNGTTTLNGPVNTDAAGGISLVGAAFTVNNTITTTAAGPVAITNTGALNLTSSAICSVAGAFTQSGLGPVTLAGQITAGGSLSFAAPITLSGNPNLSTAAASTNITLANTVDGGGNLTLASGGGNILLQGVVGGNTPIGALTISSAANVTTLGISAASITQTTGTGTTTFNGALSTTAVGGISISTNSISIGSSVTTTNGGPGNFTIANLGTFTDSPTSVFNIAGTFTQSGTGAVSFGGTLNTTNNTISFAGPITLNGTTSLNSGGTGANITLSNTVNGAQSLSLAAGSGDILLSGIIGGTTPLSALTFTSGHNVTIQQAITANSISQVAGTGTSTFNGTLSATTSSGIVLTGSTFTFNNTVTTTNAGVFTLTNSGTAQFLANFTISGIFTQSGSGGVSLNAALLTNDTNLTIGSAITLLGNSSISSGGTGLGNVTLSSTVDGGHTLSLLAGTGNLTVSGTIGGITPLTSLSASGNNISLGSIGTAVTAGVSGSVTVTATTDINFNGANYHTASQTYSAALANINAVPSVTCNSSGSNIDCSSIPVFIGAGSSLIVNSGGGSITMSSIDAGTGSGRGVTLNSGAGDLTLANVGTSGNGEIGSLSLTGANIFIRGNLFTNAISFTTSSPNQIFLGGDITTVNNPIIFPLTVNIIRDTQNNSTLTTNGGDIQFQGAIDGDVASVRRLTIAAGSGNTTFSGAIGGTTPLDQLVINSSNNVSLAGVSVGSMTQLAGTGTTTFNGQVTTSTSSGLNLTGSGFTFLNGVTTTTNNGNITINNSGTLTINSGTAWNLGGSFSQTGSGGVSLAVHVIDANTFTTASPITLIGNTTIDTSSTPSQIHLNNTVDGGFDLTLIAGTDNVFVTGAMGSNTRIGNFLVSSATSITTQSISASSINLTWGTGTFTFSGTLNTNTLSGISLTGTNIFVNSGIITTSNGGPLTVTTSGTTSGTAGGPTVVSGSITQSSTGTGFIGGTFISLTGNITTAHNIILQAPLIADTSAGGGNIIIQGTIDGSFPLTFNAGTGNVDLQQNVGSSTRIGALTINSANNVTTQAVTASSIQQVAGTGTTTFNGPLSTNALAGISVSSASIALGSAITTTNNGPCAFTISNAGTFTNTPASPITVSGAFTQSGSGAVSFGGSLTTNNNNISFAGPIAMSADTTLNTGSLVGDVTLSSTVQGAHNLNITAGTGSVTFGGNVGTGITPLTSVVINSALNVTSQAITAGFIQQSNGTGTSTFNGALSTNTATGIALTGAAFNFNAPFTTTAAGTFTLTNSGLAAMSAAATGSVAGNFLQNGSNTTQLSNSITSTAGFIEFSGPVTLSGTASLTTSAQPITLLSTLDSTASTLGSLTVSCSGANFTIGGNAGLVHALNALTIAAAQDVSAQAITAGSIVQTTGSGTSTFNGDLTTSGTGVNLTGSAFTFFENITANGGTISIVNSGLLTTSLGKTLFADGGFSESGTGTVSLASNVTATNNNISFTRPITLTSNVVLNSGTTAGDITVGSVDGGFNLTFTAGRDINAGVIGGGTRLGVVTATTVRNNTASSITAGSIVQLAGTGTTSLTGNINTNTAAGINLVGTNFSRSGDIITTNGGSFVVTNSGLITGTSINTTSIDGSYTQISGGPSSAFDLAGTISARQGISLSSPITLLSDPGNLTPIILDTSGGNGNILVTNTINNDVNAPHTLTLRSGGGSINLTGAIGGTSAIGPFKLGNVNNFTAVAISADSIQQEAATAISGNAIFNGAISTTGSISGATGISLPNTFAVFLNNNITTASGGVVSITETSQLSISSSVVANLDGAFTQTGAGPVSLGGSITTTNDNISFTSVVTLNGSTSLNTGSGIGDITFSSSIDGAFSLDLTAGTGNISLQSIGSSIPPTGLTVNSAATIAANANILAAGPISLTTAGILTFSGSVTTTSGGTIDVTNGGTLTITNPIVSDSSFIQSQTGTPSISLNANISTTGTLQLASSTTLTNNIIFNSGGGAITLAGTINSDATPRNFTLTAGSGDIILSSALGGTPLSAFQITSAGNVTATNISAASILQSSGTGLSHFTGTLSTTALGGVSLTGSQFTLDNIVTTTNSGPLSISHTGLLTLNSLPALGSHSLSGAFSETGGGNVSTGANITTSDQPISFADAVTLTHDSTQTSNNGNIIYSSSIDGPFCLTLAAGTGAITLNGPIGSTTSLGCFTATGSTILQNSSLTSTGAVQETGAMTINGNITTSANNITLTGNVSVTNANTTFSTGGGGGGGTIHITGTVNPNVSSNNFTAQTGTAGTITFDSALGGLVPFHNVTITSGVINLNDFGSTSTGANGTASFTAITNLNFTGTTYNNGIQNYTAGSNFNFNNGALTTITSNNNTITFATGTINLSVGNDLTINSNGGNVTLTDLTGPHRNLIINAGLGVVTVAHIDGTGTPTTDPDCLNSITITGSNLIHPFPTCPPITFIPSTPTFISTNVNDPSSYAAPVIITADGIQFNYTSCPGSNILFESTLDSDVIGSARNVTFNMCPTNTLTFGGTVGGSAPLSSITVNDGSGVTANSGFTVGAFTFSTAQPAIAIFNNGITTVTNAGTGSTGNVSITCPTITLKGASNIAGSVQLIDSSTLTASNVNLNVTGSFQESGGGLVTISGNVMTTDNLISFADPITIDNNLTLDTVSATGADITVDTVDGPFSLTFIVGSGSITAGDIGSTTPLSAVTATSVNNISAQNITAGTIQQIAGSGTTSLHGNIQSTSSLGITLVGTNFTRSGDIITTNGGSFTVTNSGLITGTSINTTSIDGSYTQISGGPSSANNLAGTISARLGISLASPITLLSDAGNLTPIILDTTGGNGNILVTNTINNDVNAPHTLIFRAGTGNVNLTGAIGGTAPIGPLQLGNLNNFTSNAISADSISQVAATTITGLVTFNGAISTTGATGIVLTAPQFALNNNITTTGGGLLTLTHTGSLAFANNIALSLSGAFSESGGGTVSLAGSITSTTPATNITFNDVVNLTGSTALDSDGGNISFGSTVDGAQSLDLTAGAGSITFTGNVGNTNSIGALTIHSVTGITYPLVNAVSINQLGNSGTTTITGPITTTGVIPSTTNGISLVGGVFNQNGTITTLNSGSLAINHSGTLTMGAAASSSIGGDYVDNALSTGAISMRNSIISGGLIAFNGTGAITLTAATALTSGVSNGSITINPTVDGANNLTLNASGDLILFNSNIGSTVRIGALTINSASIADFQQIKAASLSQLSGTGTTTFHDIIDVNGASGISLIGSAFTFDNTVTSSAGPVTITNSNLANFITGANVSSSGDFQCNGTGNVQLANTVTTTNGIISLQSPIILTGTTSLNSSAGNKAITLHSTATGANNLSLSSGSGNITALSNIGSGITSLGSFSAASSGTLSFQSINAAAITQTGTATATYNMDLSATAGNINLAGSSITFEGNATASGSIAINISTLFSTALDKTLTANGGFSQTGAGDVSLGSSVLANNNAISFVSPITLTDDVLLNSLSGGLGGGDITVDTVDGPFSLTFTAGSGNITAGAIGSSITLLPPTAVIATSVNNNNAQSITAGTIQQLSGTGTTTLNGTITSTSSLGITLVGNNFTRNGDITTTNGGSFTVTNSGLITGNPLNTTSIDGSYIQNGTGTSNFAGTINARTGISFTGPILMGGDGTFTHPQAMAPSPSPIPLIIST